MGKTRAIFVPTVTGIAILLLFAAADYSQRTRDLVDLKTKCKDVASSPGCTAYFPLPAPTPSAAVTADTALLQRLETCEKAQPRTTRAAVEAQVWATAVAKCAGLPLPVGSVTP